MINLFIDTSSADVSIALYNKDKKIAEKQEYILNKHSIYVASYIDKILKDNDISGEDIQKIYVVNGPGSFTGIRIGITIAKTMAYLKNIKLCGVSSLKQRILNQETSNYYLSLIDAKNDNYYYGLYDKDYNTIKEEFNNIDIINSIIDKYNPKVVANTDIEKLNVKKTKLDIQKIINYYQNEPESNSFNLQINYLKNPAGIEVK